MSKDKQELDNPKVNTQPTPKKRVRRDSARRHEATLAALLNPGSTSPEVELSMSLNSGSVNKTPSPTHNENTKRVKKNVSRRSRKSSRRNSVPTSSSIVVAIPNLNTPSEQKTPTAPASAPEANRVEVVVEHSGNNSTLQVPATETQEDLQLDITDTAANTSATREHRNHIHPKKSSNTHSSGKNESKSDDSRCTTKSALRATMGLSVTTFIGSLVGLLVSGRDPNGPCQGTQQPTGDPHAQCNPSGGGLNTVGDITVGLLALSAIILVLACVASYRRGCSPSSNLQNTRSYNGTKESKGRQH